MEYMFMKVKSFDVVVAQDEESKTYFGSVPALPGCYSQGDTVNELLEHMKEAIELHLEVTQELKTQKESRFIGMKKVSVHA